MAVAAAAIPAVSAEIEAMKLMQGASREFIAWARSPFYTNTRTTTRSWTEIDKTGKAHSLTETKVRGFSISNGFVLGMIVIAWGWEVGLAIAKAIQGWFGNSSPQSLVMDAIDIMAAPVVLAYDASNALVGVAVSIGSTVASAAGQITNPTSPFWDWLDGRGATNKTPPPSAVKTATMPATAMAAHNQALTAIISPIGGLGTQISQKLINAIQNQSTS